MLRFDRIEEPVGGKSWKVMKNVSERVTGVIESAAPARMNDLGGWTDTWFSRCGNVLSIAIEPGANCRLSCAASRPPRRGSFTLDVRDFGDRYSFDPVNPDAGRHPLLEAAVAEMDVPRGVAVEASIRSDLPPGCGVGTSAAVVVALVGALDRLTPGTLERDSVWRTAHRVETGRLGQESGIQDQICATFGGVLFIEIRDYPDARISRLEPAEEVLCELEDRLILVYMGRSHKSTEVHREVIDRLVNEGSGSAQLAALRRIPVEARGALAAGDMAEYGRLMVENTEQQRALHPGLVSTDADRVIGLAGELGALGWKVNGAGGQGGSLTVLAADADSKSEFVERLESFGGGIRSVPVKIDGKGLHVIER